MKKGILKTILKDFFKLRYVIIWVVIIVLVGTGVVLAGVINAVNTGYKLNGDTADRPITTLSGGVIVNNSSADSDYFIPTKNFGEFPAFVQNCPSTVTVVPALCVAGTYYDHNLRCTDTCLTCPANYYCSSGNKYPCPSGTTSPAGSTSFSACIPTGGTCTPQRSCISFAGQDCGTDSCGTACGPVCPTNEFCDNKHFCEPNP